MKVPKSKGDFSYAQFIPASVIQSVYTAVCANKTKQDNMLWEVKKALPKQFKDACQIPVEKPPSDGRWTVKVSVWFDQPADYKVTSANLEKVFGASKAAALSIPKTRGVSKKPNSSNAIRLRYPVRVYQLAALHAGMDWKAFDEGEASHLCGNGDFGCINRNHIVIEPKKINLDRKPCWYIIRCIVCHGNIAGNQCEGHTGSDTLCLRPRGIGDVCQCANWNGALSAH